MDKLDTSKWKYFEINELFEIIETTKGTTTDELVFGNDVPYIAAKKDDNGFDGMYENEPSFVSKGNCIVFINIGEGSAGYSLYQDRPFIGMKGKTTCGYNCNLNKYSALFLVTILDKERYRYSYGRSYSGDRLLKTRIKLPVTLNGNPDWKFMEEFIKRKYKSIEVKSSTKNHSSNTNIDTKHWKDFKLKQLFDIYTGSDFILQDAEIGDVPLATHSIENNSISAFVNKECNRKLFNSNISLSVSDRGNFKTFVQSKDFYIGTRVKALECKINISKKSLLFISTIINKESFRFAYGRNATENIGNIIIKLPINEKQQIDFQFMESYIEKLPNGDLI
jgi:type II DNA modification protein